MQCSPWPVCAQRLWWFGIIAGLKLNFSDPEFMAARRNYLGRFRPGHRGSKDFDHINEAVGGVLDSHDNGTYSLGADCVQMCAAPPHRTKAYVVRCAPCLLSLQQAGPAGAVCAGSGPASSELPAVGVEHFAYQACHPP